jgi:hypothetical protein
MVLSWKGNFIIKSLLNNCKSSFQAEINGAMIFSLICDQVDEQDSISLFLHFWWSMTLLVPSKDGITRWWPTYPYLESNCHNPIVFFIQNTWIGTQQNNANPFTNALHYLPLTRMYSPTTIISTESWKLLPDTIDSRTSYKRGDRTKTGSSTATSTICRTACLILPHPILTAIACHLHIIMNGHPQCSLYATALMLLHIIVSLWSPLNIPMIRKKSHEHSMVLVQTLFMILYWKMMCQLSWRARWNGEYGSGWQNIVIFSYQGSLTSLEAPYVDSNCL